ncbi:2-amino-4-hydroxy-6-hydroxymethyldihydropteridine diphosphokinase [Rhodobacter capsulatus]|nr:2-amino-4-hydroxy-6-hydroxymethyldihydropteridine diphosphokinase [Rhodobacter capsulatus]
MLSTKRREVEISVFKDNSTFFVALGANLATEAGNPPQSLVAALKMLPEEGIRLRALSRFWRSPAFPAGAGPDYVNACAVVSAAMTPEAVLSALHRIEARLGRRRNARWESRGIDLDLLACGAAIRPDAATEAHWRGLPLDAQMQLAPETLILPHPRLADRAFVLIPLAEIAPLWRHPVTGKTVGAMLAALDATEKAAMVPFSAPFDG